ncbi:YtzC family protein [Bacillus velezensis]
MATRQSVDEHLQRSEQAYEFANEQFITASKQEHYNDNEYSEAQMMLENAVNELNKLSLSANDQQRETLPNEIVQTLQNNMILQRNFDY